MGPSKIIENFKKNCENSEMNSMYSGPRLIIFWCGPFLKSLLNLLQYCFCFMFWFFGHKACGILIPWPGIRPTNPAMEMQSLSPWTTREVPRVVIALSFFSLPFSYIHIYVHLYVHTYTHTFFLNHLRVWFSSSVMSSSLQPHELQYARLPCLSPTPRVYPNPGPLSRWCHPTISSSVAPFSSYLQSFPASGSFLVSRLFTSGGQSIGVSASASVLPVNIQGLFPLGLTGSISLQSNELSRVFSQFKSINFGSQLSLWSNSHIHTWLQEKPKLWLDGPLLAK